MARSVFRTATIVVIALLGPALCRAGTLTYNPASGLLPEQSSAAWSYVTNNGTPPTRTVSGGTLTLTSGITPRGFWNGNLLQAGVSAGSNLFMETTARVVSESHTSTKRGENIFQLERTTAGLSGTTNEVDGYAWTDRIFWTNSLDQVVGQYLVDTTVDHTYRLEIDGDNDYIFVDGVLAGAVLNNTYQNGDPNQQNVLNAVFGDGTAASGGTTVYSQVIAGSLEAAIVQDNPVIPSESLPIASLPPELLPPPGSGTVVQGAYVFNNVPSGRWFDPPFVDSFIYTMTTAGSLFTKIDDFPTGFGNVNVSVGGTLLGSYGPGQSVSFGSGVSSFMISGIHPLVDAASATAFPLQLEFSTPTADFAMLAVTSVPEPGSVVVWSIAAGILGIVHCLPRNRRTVAA